jgi:hypothetical protein
VRRKWPPKSIAIASNVMATPGNVLQPSSDLADAFA